MERANRVNPVVLFVDDDRAILESLSRCLRREAYALLFAESGTQALSMLAQQHVDVVVSDERMPGTCGSELLIRVREIYPDIVRMLMTGGATLDEAARAIGTCGIYRFLNKPVSADVLVRTLDNAVAMKALLSANTRLRLQLDQSLSGRRLAR